jgi:glycerol-3-phosphate acyltransferase PlsY
MVGVGHKPVTAAAVVAASYVAGSVPVSNIAARHKRGVDLRDVGSGTVSGTSLYRVTGFGTLAAAGIVEIGKGALGPWLAGGRREPVLAALCGGAAVAGHNWSPWLRGAGGRGISPAIGALLVTAPVGAAVLLGGLVLGRLGGETALGSVVADFALVPTVRRVHGDAAARAAGAVLVPMVAKRLAGNAPVPRARRLRTYAVRLLYDRDAR